MNALHHKGFTLIEVLIALAIISIAMTAIIKTTSQNIKNTIYLQNKIIATWTGNLIINNIRAGLLTPPLAPDESHGKITTLNQTWQWQAQKILTQNTNIKKIHVSISELSNETPVITLESYIYEPKK